MTRSRTSRIVLSLLGFFVCLFGIGLPVSLATRHLGPTAQGLLSGAAMTAAALGLVFVLRRYVDRAPFKEVLKLGEWPMMLGGMALALGVTTVAGAVTVWLGYADWTGAVARFSPFQVALMVGAVLLTQAFPEELIFRGYVFGTLPAGWIAVIVSSVVFGSLHVLSNGGATTIGERLLYAVMAIGYGLMLAACRTVSGAIWLGVGFHTAHNATTRMFVEVHDYGPALMITFGSLVVAALITFAAGRRRFGRRPAATPAPVPRTAAPRPE